MVYVWIWLGMSNLVAFVLSGIDKRRAVRRAWRVPERHLMALAAVGGAVGLYTGCRVFHHKTNRAKFMVWVPLMFVVQATLVLVLVFWIRLP